MPVGRLGTWGATAMVVSEVVGVGIFLTPATMMRTLPSVTAALGVWAVMAALTIAGALCYAELTTRFPKAGGTYVLLREAFGPRTAFLYGWMALLVVDPGLTAALGIGFAQYLLAAAGASADRLVPVALASIAAFAALTLTGFGVSARLMRWTAAAKLAMVGVLLIAGAMQASHAPAVPRPVVIGVDPGALASAIIAAFFAFGGWWELGRMSEEVGSPRRTMPRALIGGVALVAAIYALVTIAFVMAGGLAIAQDDAALVSLVGQRLFGANAGRLLAAMVVVAVAGSLAAVLFGAPRVYLAMARDGLFWQRLARFDPVRGTAPAATILQASLACTLVLLGSFDQILGYFVPVAVFFLGLSASAILVLPRPGDDGRVFRAPLHPLPIALFLILIVSILALFLMGRPYQTLLGACVMLLGVPLAWMVVARR